MNALKAVWSDTRMVVLTALSAALYAALLIPFKMFPIIPGTTELRPANALPIVCSLLFGPAGAWGAAIGNGVGDLFTAPGPGKLFGFAGNFLFGFVPFAFWRTMFGTAMPDSRKVSHWLALVFIMIVASAACAWPIAWGLDVMFRVPPFALVGTVIFFNNLLMALVIAPPLLFSLLPRARRWGLLYTDILPPERTRAPRLAWLGLLLMTAGGLGGLAGGLGISIGVYKHPIGVPWVLKQIHALQAAPAVAPAVVVPPTASTSPAPRAVPARPAAPAAPSAATPASVSATVPAAAAPLSGRATMALGLLPAWALLVAGLLLL